MCGTDSAEQLNERNRIVALKANSMVGQFDLDEFTSLFVNEPVWHVGQRVYRGHSGLMEICEISRRVFPNGAVRETRLVLAQGDTVVLQYVTRADVAHGRNYQNEYAKVMHFSASGLIMEVWEYLDTAYAASILGV
jgi:ketosteroid isomerase-like protein